jgi:16S rRNA (guanine527-N7)-methyltransferase
MPLGESPEALVETLPRWVREALESAQPGAFGGEGPLDPAVIDRLVEHAACLARWQNLTSLIGSGTWREAAVRHYEESLWGLSLSSDSGRMVDLGSGAGFPGLVLAAARPQAEVHLIEGRQRKAAFLRQAAYRMGLPNVTVHAVRIEQLASARGRSSQARLRGVDCITLRAIRLGEEEWHSLLPLLTPSARILRWEGADELDPELPFRRLRQVTLPSGDHRQIAIYEALV